MGLIVTNSVHQQWLLRPRTITWKFYLGISIRKRPVATGNFQVSLSYLDNQGDKWGETYVKGVGQHYDDYSNWSTRQSLYPLGTGSVIPKFIPHTYEGRTYKEAAPGVTGLIGEVIVTTFLQKVLKLRPYEVAHLKSNNTYKAPDMCLDIQPQKIADLLPPPKSKHIIDYLHSLNWANPLPLECKGRKNKKINHIRTALSQLITYWKNVPDMAGYGVITQIDVMPSTVINIHFLAPNSTQVNHVRDIILGNILPRLPDQPTLKEFERIIGVRLLG